MTGHTAPQALMGAIASFLDGRPEDALAHLAELAEEALPDPDKDGGRALGVEIACLDRLGREADARRRMYEALATQRDRTRFILWIGNQLSDLGCFDHAERTLLALAEIDPADALPRYNLGVMLHRTGRVEEAIAAFDEALERHGTFEDALANKALCLEELARWDEAAETHRRYLKNVPRDAHEWISLAIVETQRGRFDEAYEAYRQAAHLEPDNVNVHFNWAVTALRREDAASVEECAAALGRVAPDDWRALAVEGDVRALRGETWPAWEAKREAAEAALGDADASSEDVAAATAGALWFAARHGLDEPARDLVSRAFERGVPEPKVLAALRALEGRHSTRAFRFRVVVGSASGAPAGRHVCDVLAEDEAEAGRVVGEFTARIEGASGGRMVEVRRLDGPHDANLGVMRCTPLPGRPQQA